MSGIKIHLPDHFVFSTHIPVRITDLNYGRHVGNDAILSLIHEVRVQFLSSLGYEELSFAGASLIMSDVGIEFRAEAFYGDIITAQVAVGEVSRVAFELYYKLWKAERDNEVVIAMAKTGMVCYDYQQKKVIAIPEEARKKLNGH